MANLRSTSLREPASRPDLPESEDKEVAFGTPALPCASATIEQGPRICSHTSTRGVCQLYGFSRTLGRPSPLRSVTWAS
jgi:hypothetical protein